MTVYIPQLTRRRDPATGDFVPAHDVSSASEYGELVELLSPRAVPYNSATIIAELHEKLADYDPERDYILLMGDPALIGWTVAIASEAEKGRVRMLKWSMSERRYLVIDAAIFPD